MTAILQAAFRYITPIPEQAPPLVQKTSLWFRLPYELREQIYLDFFAEHVSSTLYISPTENCIFADPITEGTHHTALLRTCKAIHAEALPILHATHNVHLLVSDPRGLSWNVAPPSPTPTVYHPQTRVCSRSDMLDLLQHRLTRVTVTVRLTSVSPSTRLVQKLAWLLEMLGRREKRLAHLKLHVLDNMTVFSGCCPVSEYRVGSRWDVYVDTAAVATLRGYGCCGVMRCGCEMLEECAEAWEVVVSMNEGRVAMGDDAQGHWDRLSGDLGSVERVLGERKRWWRLNASADMWDSISENPDGYWW
jgi:hypothetical protein